MKLKHWRNHLSCHFFLHVQRTNTVAINKLLCLKICQLKTSKSWGPFWSYQLNSSANPGPKDFDFYNCHGCQTFFLAEILCYLSALKSWNNDLFISSFHIYGKYQSTSTSSWTYNVVTPESFSSPLGQYFGMLWQKWDITLCVF